MFDFLHDPNLLGVFALLAVVMAILVPWAVHLLERQQKAFSYAVKSNTPLLSVSKEISSRIQILLDGKPVQDIRLVLIRLGNSGNVEIAPEDFYEPVSICFADDGEVLEAEIVEMDPTSLKPVLSVKPTAVTLDPLLLNREDEITVKVLGHKLGNLVKVNGRIKGVKGITDFIQHVTYWSIVKRILDVKISGQMWAILLGYGVLFGLVGALSKGNWGPLLLSIIISPFIAALILISIATIVYIVIAVERWRKR